jgi:hypothetical protein
MESFGRVFGLFDLYGTMLHFTFLSSFFFFLSDEGAEKQRECWALYNEVWPQTLWQHEDRRLIGLMITSR